MERRLTLDEALADVLRRLDEGESVDLERLRRRYPRHWEDLHQTLVLMSWLDPEPTETASVERVDRWEPLEMLGEGGAGLTWRARDTDGGPDVCLKILRPELAARRGSVSRFLREARLGLEVQHPNVVRAIGVGACTFRGRRTAYLALELVEGETLRERLRRPHPPDADEIRRIGLDLAQGLAAIHAADAIHLDLKPENVLLTAGGTARITDLGIAHADDVAGPRRGFAGTLRYAAPEQFASGLTYVDERADLFALGAVLFELVAQRPLRAAHTVDDLVLSAVTAQEHIDEGVLDSPFAPLIRALLHPDPAERPGSAKEVAHALRTTPAVTTDAPQRKVDALGGLAALRRTPLIGREDALAQFDALLAALGTGTGGVLLITGAAGVGKSRLVAELAQRAAEAGVQVRVGGPETRSTDQTGVRIVPDLFERTPQERARFLEERANATLLVFEVPADTPRDAVAGIVAFHPTRVIELGTLDAVAAQSLFLAVAGRSVAVEDDRTTWLDAAGGLPFAIVMAAEYAAATRGAGTSVTQVVSRPGVDVPRAVLTGVNDELERLTPADHERVHWASLVGEEGEVQVQLDAAAALFDLEPEATARELRRIAAIVSVLVPHADGVRFSHPMVRAAVAALMPLSVSRAAHRRLAEWLSPADGEAPTGEEAVRVAHHRLAAGDTAGISDVFFAACDHLLMSQGHRRLHRMTTRGLACDELADGPHAVRLRLFHAMASVLVGSTTEGVRVAEDALARTEGAEPARRLASLQTALNVLFGHADLARTTALADEALRLSAESDDARSRANALRYAVQTAQKAGDMERAARHLDELRDIAERTGDPVWRMMWLHLSAAGCAVRGEHESQLALLGELTDVATRVGHAHLADGARSATIVALMQLARCGPADTLAAEAIEEVRRAGHAGALVYLLRLRAYVRAWCGDVAMARRNFSVAVRYYEQVGQLGAEAESLAGLAETEARLGDPRHAFSTLRRAVRLARRDGRPSTLPHLFLAGARIALAAGRTGTAGRLARASAAAAELQRDPVTVHSAEIHAHLAAARVDDARTALTRPDLRLRGYDPVWLPHRLWLATDDPHDLERVRAAVTRFLDDTGPELRALAREASPEVRALV